MSAGLELRGVTAIVGEPGTGKTSLCMRIAHEALRAGRRVLWVSLYEGKDLFLQEAAGLGYKLEGVDFWEAVMAEPEAFWNRLLDYVAERRPDVLVLDSVTPLVEGVGGRSLMLNALYRVLRPSSIDVFMTVEVDTPPFVLYIADNVVRLFLERTEEGVPERKMCIDKARGLPGGYCRQFDIISSAGLVFFDELKPVPGRPAEVRTGTALDELVGGSFLGNTLLLGPVGSGKTRLAVKIAAAAAANGYKVVYRSFAEEPWQIKELAKEYGADFEVMAMRIKPPTYGTHVYEFYRLINEARPDLLVSDGFDVEFRVYGEKAFELNMRMLSALKEAGVAFVGTMAKSYGLANYVDNVLRLRRAKEGVVVEAIKSFRKPKRTRCVLTERLDCS
ncbi:MAG: RAD55 family ATPase [Thermoproteus sp.]